MEPIEKQIRTLTDRILADYGKGRYIDRETIFTRPDKDVVEDILEKLQKLIYPGFFKAQSYRYFTLENCTRMRRSKRRRTLSRSLFCRGSLISANISRRI